MVRCDLSASCALLCGFIALLPAVAGASCSCGAPALPDPATEIAAKVAVGTGILAYVGYRYFKQRAPRL